MYENFVYMYVCAPCMNMAPADSREEHWISGTGAMDSLKVSCECWQPNPGSL